jgi:hypothetical protein
MHFRIDTANGVYNFDGNRVVVVGGDSVIVRNGNGGEQTVIRVQNDSNGTQTTTSVVVISKSRKGGKRQAAKATVDTVGSGGPSATVATSSNVEGYMLSENIPNPFTGSTTLTFTLGKPGATQLTVFDATGKVIKTLVDGDLPAGTHTATFDAKDLPSGLYLYRLVSGSFSQTRTMTLQK